MSDTINPRLDLNADGDFNDANELQLVEDFVDTNNFGVLEPTYDAAGNLTFDGEKQYTYDALNRLVKVSNAYRDDSSGNVQVGSPMAEYTYDASGRRIEEKTYLGGVLDNVEHFYYHRQSLIETRNGSDIVVQQNVWDNLAPGSGQYIDSLAQTRNDTNESLDGVLEDELYALQDQQFNILAITDDTGQVVERYEYSLYGQRTVYSPALTNRGTSAYSMHFGFQGLYHDQESGLVYNRTRVYNPKLGRFNQRDLQGGLYPDGLNTYAAYHIMRGGLDPWGLAAGDVTIVVERSQSENSTVGTFKFYIEKCTNPDVEDKKYKFEDKLVLEGATLELPHKKMDLGFTNKTYPIPDGEYSATRDNGRSVYAFARLENPDKFTDILIHSGSKNYHSRGCLLFGESVSQQRVSRSREREKHGKKSQWWVYLNYGMVTPVMKEGKTWTPGDSWDKANWDDVDHYKTDVLTNSRKVIDQMRNLYDNDAVAERKKYVDQQGKPAITVKISGLKEGDEAGGGQ